MRSPNFYCAAYAVVRNHQWQVLLLQRQNTGYLDGYWNLPAGHVENGEDPIDACIRELYEEAGLTTQKENLTFLAYSTHPAFGQPFKYLDFTFVVNTYTGEAKNNESEKCSQIGFFPLNNLPENIIPEQLAMLKKIS